MWISAFTRSWLVLSKYDGYEGRCWKSGEPSLHPEVQEAQSVLGRLVGDAFDEYMFDSVAISQSGL